MPNQPENEKRLETAAYYIWLEEGRPHGKHEEHWHKARVQLDTKPPKPMAARAKAKASSAASASRAARGKTKSATSRGPTAV
jgi:hypothetical protein